MDQVHSRNMVLAENPPAAAGDSSAPGERLELSTNGLTVPTRPSVQSGYVQFGAVLSRFCPRQSVQSRSVQSGTATQMATPSEM